MPVGSRVRTNNVFGLVSDNPLTTLAPTLNSNGLANLPAISGSQHAIITLDPLRVNGVPEIVIVTAHTIGLTLATISRGAYGTTPRIHPQGTLWTHTPMNEDFIQILTSITRPTDPYNGEIIYETDTKAYKVREAVGSAWEDLIYPVGSWSTWVPFLTNMTIGNGSLSCKFIKIGRAVHLRFLFTLGSTSAIGTDPSFSLPVPAATYTDAADVFGTANLQDTGVANRFGQVWFQAGRARILGYNTTGVAVGLTATVPHAWGTGDSIGVQGTYESAS